MVVRSKLLHNAGFTHGFSTRLGGVSTGPFASLNLSSHVGDAQDCVNENRRRFAKVFGLPPQALVEVNQVHGSIAYEAREGSSVGEIALSGQAMKEADAVVSSRPDVALAVRTADCLPVLLADPLTGRAAAVHAGWRGVALNIVGAALRQLVPEEENRSQVLAALGPCIGFDAFEIGSDVAEQLSAAVPRALQSRCSSLVQSVRGRMHGDLQGIVRAQLQSGGIDSSRIDILSECTHSAKARYFSHRRDQGKTGRHLSAIRPLADGVRGGNIDTVSHLPNLGDS